MKVENEDVFTVDIKNIQNLYELYDIKDELIKKYGKLSDFVDGNSHAS